jgi:UDP:flavonoid glycosyltransferase YjiC (YdhE family)
MASSKKHILIAPLDWGLGHATRCVPIIKQLLCRNARVTIAAEGLHLALLQKELPDCSFISLPGYSIQYGRTAVGTSLKITWQVPKILKAIRREQRWLAAQLPHLKPDIIISDNRYGFRHEGIPSVFITHQLTIASPFGRFSENVLQRLNYRFVNQFTRCWVPDLDQPPGLSGMLGHPAHLPDNARYIGPQSRFTKIEKPQTPQYDLLCILSGPEPQRSIWQQQLLNQLLDSELRAVVVGGTNHLFQQALPERIQYFASLDGATLHRYMQQSRLVLSRCGYSTVMDMYASSMPCILVPTPGQTEQEYLAVHLKQQGLFYSVSQHQLDLRRDMAAAEAFYTPGYTAPSSSLLEQALDELWRIA